MNSVTTEALTNVRALHRQTAITWLAILACSALLVGAVAGRKSHTLQLFALVGGMSAATIGKLAQAQRFDLQQYLEDLDYSSREARLYRLRDELIAPGGKSYPGQIDSTANPSEIEIVEAGLDWLTDVVYKSNHFRICGETGSGKSTLIANLLECSIQAFGSTEGLDIIWVDPKYPMSECPVDPKFKGIEEALGGLELLAQTVEDRLHLARKDKERGQPVRDFTPLIFAIDEIDWVVSEYEKQATKLLKVGLKVGRALKVRVAYIGQSPLCSDLLLRRNDFRHSSSLFLGEGAYAGINEVCHTTQQKRFLREQLAARQARGDEYYGLIKMVSRSPFTATLPKPNYYGKQPAQVLQAELSNLEGLSSMSSLPPMPEQGVTPQVLSNPGQLQQAAEGSVDQLKLAKIQELQAQGVIQLKQIIPAVYGCPANQNSREFRRCRADFKRLTGR